jgi:hypothetical protein
VLLEGPRLPHTTTGRLERGQGGSATLSCVTPAPELDCLNCYLGKVGSIEWEWPLIRSSSLVVATIILKVDRSTNTTSTRTIYNNLTATTPEASDYGPGVTIIDGTPILTLTATVSTQPGITFTTVLYVYQFYRSSEG